MRMFGWRGTRGERRLCLNDESVYFFFFFFFFFFFWGTSCCTYSLIVPWCMLHTFNCCYSIVLPSLAHKFGIICGVVGCVVSHHQASWDNPVRSI